MGTSVWVQEGGKGHRKKQLRNDGRWERGQEGGERKGEEQKRSKKDGGKWKEEGGQAQ